MQAPPPTSVLFVSYSDEGLDCGRRFRNIIVGWLLMVGLGALVGCANNLPSLTGHPKFGAKTSPIVVIGYFTEPKNLDVPPCPESEPGSSIIAHCYGSDPWTRLTVREVLFGHVSSSRTELLALYTAHPERFPTGRQKPQLVYLQNFSFADADDKIGYLERYQPLVKLQSGELAVPVATDKDLPHLPCSGERLLEVVRLNFAEPFPRRPADEYTEAELASLRENSRVHIRDKSVYFDFGITLSEIRKAIEEMAKDDYYDACWDDSYKNQESQ